MVDISPQLISLNEACRITSLSRTAINMRRAAGTFPQPVPMDGRRIAFVRSEVEDWIRDRIAERATGEKLRRRGEAMLAHADALEAEGAA